MIIPYNCPNCNAEIPVEFKGLKRKVVTCESCEKETQVPDDLCIGPGAIIGNGYKLEKKVGESHLGDIFLAIKEDEGRLVRIEILSGQVASDEESVTRFLQEIDLMSSMKHKSLLSAVDKGEDNGTYFLVTAHEPGVSLEEKIKSNGAVDEKSALNYLVSIADVLGYTWNERKLLHRDIKPQNIFITESNTAKLTGFGIAKSSEGQSLGLTGVGFTIGTPEYMSPEQIRASEDLDLRSDLYSLGVVLYETLTGGLPFMDDAPILLMQKHMDEVPVPVREKNPQISARCSALVDKMLAKLPEDRFSSWEELIAEANETIEAPDVEPEPVIPASPEAQPTAAPSASSPQPTTAEKPLGSKSPIGLVVAIFIGIIIIILLLNALKII